MKERNCFVVTWKAKTNDSKFFPWVHQNWLTTFRAKTHLFLTEWHNDLSACLGLAGNLVEIAWQAVLPEGVCVVGRLAGLKLSSLVHVSGLCVCSMCGVCACVHAECIFHAAFWRKLWILFCQEEQERHITKKGSLERSRLMRFDEWEASNAVGKVYVVHTRIKEIQTSDTCSMTVAVSGI